MKKLVSRILLVLAVLIGLASMVLAYAYLIEPRRLVVIETELRVPHFEPALNGLRVVAISDIHGGSNNVTAEKLRQLVTVANAQNPDLIVLLGDYVSQTEGKSSPLKMPVEEVAENLKGFSARYGVYGVIGNHDWWYDEVRVTKALESAGITVLENETREVNVNGVQLSIWGIEDHWKRESVPTEPVAAARNILALTHNPDSLLQSPSNIALMFAGHSHGGQIYFPFYGRKAFVNDPRFMYGHAVVEGKNVFVTSGVGTSVVSLRLGTPPEIAVVTLNAAE